MSDNTLLSVIGKERFDFLNDPRNYEAIKRFIDEKLGRLDVGDRSYKFLSLFLNEDFVSAFKYCTEEWIDKIASYSGKDDGKYILQNQRDISDYLRGKVTFVFINWHHPNDLNKIIGVSWSGSRWFSKYYNLEDIIKGDCSRYQVVCRIK